MPPKTIKFEIVTPERVVFAGEVLQATIPTKEGEVTILPDHIPLISILIPGVIEIKTKEKNKEIAAVSGGFVEVTKDKIVVLADTSEKAEEINIEKAEEAKRRAEEIKKEIIHKDDIRFAEMSSKIEKEFARSSAVKRWRKIKKLN